MDIISVKEGGITKILDTKSEVCGGQHILNENPEKNLIYCWFMQDLFLHPSLTTYIYQKTWSSGVKYLFSCQNEDETYQTLRNMTVFSDLFSKILWQFSPEQPWPHLIFDECLSNLSRTQQALGGLSASLSTALFRLFSGRHTP